MIRDALDRLLAAELVDEDGNRVEPKLLPGMTDAEIDGAGAELGHPFPPDLRALLGRSRGIEGLAIEPIDFAGMDGGQALEDLFPEYVTIAGNGFGNFWIVDLLQENGAWGPIWYLSHDPPVALYQCDGLATFIDELVRMHTPPHANLIDDVHENRLFHVGRDESGAMSREEAACSGDPVLESFAGGLDGGWTIVDLRDARPGMGISWGHHGPRTEHARQDAAPVFAYRAPEKAGRWSRRRR